MMLMWEGSKSVGGFIAPVVFARGGSKGVPNKNLLRLAGKTLLRHAVEHALNMGFSQVFVSTDSVDIAEEARDSGAEVPFMRPRELADDASPEWLSWKHFCSYLVANHDRKFSHLLVLPTTAPLRDFEDLRGVIELVTSGDWDVVVTMSQSQRHPGFNIVRQGNDGSVRPYDSALGNVARRQDAGAVYDLTTVAYGVSIDFVLRADSMWEGRVAGLPVPPWRALDIDTKLDVEFAEFLMERRQADGVQ